MFDSINLPILFEHERSTNKEIFLAYEKSSMASKCDALDQLVDQYFEDCHLSDLIKAKTPKKIITATNRIKQILRSLLWNCYRAARAHDDCFLKISLSDKSYRKSAPDNPYGITREISKVITSLESNDYLRTHIGFFDRRTGKSKQTRIRPTLSLLYDLKMLPHDIAEDYQEPVPVIVKGDDVDNLDHASRGHMNDAVATISAYNEFMRSHDVTHPDARAGFLPFLDKNGDLQLVNITRKSVQAIYHAEGGDVLTYGRIHGGMCQAIPAHYRKFILIDDEPTVELDYSAQIIHIVAGLEGIQLTGDPYSVSLPFPNLDPDCRRSMVKAATMIMLNASDRKSLYNAFRGHLRRDPLRYRSNLRLTNIVIDQIVAAVLEANPFLEKHVFSGIGKKIFMIDSAIARKIIQTFLDEEKVVLPIHDGFIVKESDKDLLEETMKRIWMETFQTTIPIKQEK
jgi:hypothetical protein